MQNDDVAALRLALKSAESELAKATAALGPRHLGGEMEAYERAYQTLLDAEREFAAAEARPYAVPEPCALKWDVGAPMPTLLQSDSRTILLFYLGDEAEAVGVLDFGHCHATCFGNPGDEAFEGDPVHGAGFEPYRAMRIVNSPWIASLQAMDSIHPHHDPSSYTMAKHLIFPFHDTTFECVAHAFKSSTEAGPLAEAVHRAVERLF